VFPGLYRFYSRQHAAIYIYATFFEKSNFKCKHSVMNTIQRLNNKINTINFAQKKES